MLLWGSPSKFVAGGWEPNQEKNEIRAIEDWQTADGLLTWINKQTSRYELSSFIA